MLGSRGDSVSTVAARQGLAGEASVTAGLAAYARLVFEQRDLQPVWDALMARASADPSDAGAMLDLSTLLQLTGRREEGLALQADALARQRLYRRVVGTGAGPRLLALVAAGDMMASTPLDFLLGGWNGVVDLLFLTAGGAPPEAPPDHDVAIVAVGESDANAPILRALPSLDPARTLNPSADAILALGRDRAPARLAGIEGLRAPRTLRRSHADLAAADDLPFPLIARPVDSHAGAGLQKLDDRRALLAYLGGRTEPTFYVSPFVDYSGPDGRFRKLRVAMVGGRPFLVHMAISDHWMVHYLNAGMDLDPAKRAEEAEAMATFETGFAARHGAALAAMHRAFGLDYFALDCAEDREGRLLLFEADTAMIVHDMDPPDLYPYKPPAMRKLFAAFQALVAGKAR
ncbi:MAG: ATP-grasp domain-containing protein [Caulobacteraceae bacterium]